MPRAVDRRPDWIVVVYVAVAGLWIIASSTLTELVASRTGLSAAAIEVSKGLVFVVVTALALWSALRRWARRLQSAEEAERRAAADATEVARLRKAFLGGISHELRTPLTNIVGFARTIERHHLDLPPGRTQDLAERLVANTERLERLILDLLDLHEPKPRHRALLEPVDVRDLLERAAREHCPASHRTGVWSSVTWAMLDEDMARRLLEELVDNVARHTPPGTEAWLAATIEDGRLHLSVEDDGPGVDPSITGVVAQPFVQGAHVDLHPSPGLGLGLSLVARYAELHDGEVIVSAPPSGGTRVDVVLPHRPVAAGPGPEVD